MTKARPNGKLIIITKEDVIIILEVVIMVIILGVEKKGIYPSSVDILVVICKVIKILIQEDLEGSPSGPKVRENLMVRRNLCNEGIGE